MSQSKQDSNSTRRQFASAISLRGGAIAAALKLGPVHASGDDTLKIGLIGCGGRGTGAATQALKADGRVKLIAMADAFADRIQMSLRSLKGIEGLESKLDVPLERQFVGFDAYNQLLASGVDVDWVNRDEGKLHYQAEHDELFASIRAGTPINNGEYMAKSTLLAIMGRMATYTGQEITWDMAWNSKEDLSPPQYAWGELETPSVAIPGVTKFV